MQNDPLAGEFGPYRVVTTLGRGGMGVVCRVVHRETGASAALKTVSSMEHRDLHGIRREIEGLARLRHPGIVRILEHGLREGVPWYAMELIEGQLMSDWLSSVQKLGQPTLPWRAAPDWWTFSLSRWEREQRSQTLAVPARSEDGAPPASDGDGEQSSVSEDVLGSGWRSSGQPDSPSADPAPAPWDREAMCPILTLLWNLCGSLAYLHGEGMVHRDLKPHNILVRANREPVLVDFGLWTRFGARASREVLELADATAGTVQYMAPEQIEGRPVDARADLYALGCLLYELVTGQPPFSGRSPIKMLRAHLTQRPVLPSQLRPGVPPELDQLLMALLAKRPQDRPGHAGAVAQVLERLGAEASPVKRTTPQPRAYLYRPELAGRAERMGQLSQFLDELDSGRGHLVLLGGESGVGKTRLAMELIRVAHERDFLVLSGDGDVFPASGTESQSEPLGVFGTALQILADHCQQGGEKREEQLLGSWGPILAPYSGALARLPGVRASSPAPKLSWEPARYRLWNALSGALSRLSGLRPVFLVLDDLQWADELSLGFLEHWAQSGAQRDVPLLILGLYRLREGEQKLRGLLTAEGIERLEIGRLSPIAIREMIGQMLAVEPPPEHFANFLSQRSAGNPFFVAEYLRTAVAEGFLHRDGEGRWDLELDLEESVGPGERYHRLPLPGGIRELLGRRLALLTPDAHRLLEDAAVLGRDVRESLLADLARRRKGEWLLSLSQLEREHLLIQERVGHWRFAHDQIRELVYQRLEPGSRRASHQAVAEALEALSDEEKAEASALLARHWAEAGEEEPASRWALRAARRARFRYALEEAQTFYQDYLHRVTSPSVESISARGEYATEVLMRFRAEPEKALEQLRKAEAEARSVGDAHILGQTLERLVDFLRATGEWSAAQTAGEEALELCRALGDESIEAGVLDNLGTILGYQLRLEEARQHLEKAREIHRRLQDPVGEAESSYRLALVALERGALDEAGDLLTQTLVLSEQSGDRKLELLAITNLAGVEQLGRRLREAEAGFRRALSLSREIRDRRSEALLLLSLGAVLSEQGQWEEAGELLDQCLPRLQAVRAQAYVPYAWWRRAELERRRGGNLKDVRRWLQEAERLFGELGSTLELLCCEVQYGYLDLLQGGSAQMQRERVERLSREQGLEAGSPTGLLVREFWKTVAAFDRGERLVRGESLGCLSPGLQRRMLRATVKEGDGSSTS